MTRRRSPEQFDLQRPTADLLLWTYSQGWFPMAEPATGVIEWFSPDPRGILELDGFHISRNLARLIRQTPFDIRADTAFDTVLRACATPRSPLNMPWMNERLHRAYVDLHQRGHAHSVEAWLDGRLVGGLYGVQIRGAYFGESMFCRPDDGGTNGSKVCLAYLVGWLRHRGFGLLDTQFWNEHLAQFGCTEIDRDDYLRRLAETLTGSRDWGVFDPDAARAAIPTADA